MTLYDFLSFIFLVTICIVALRPHKNTRLQSPTLGGFLITIS